MGCRWDKLIVAYLAFKLKFHVDVDNNSINIAFDSHSLKLCPKPCCLTIFNDIWIFYNEHCIRGFFIFLHWMPPIKRFGSASAIIETRGGTLALAKPLFPISLPDCPQLHLVIFPPFRLSHFLLFFVSSFSQPVTHLSSFSVFYSGLSLGPLLTQFLFCSLSLLSVLSFGVYFNVLMFLTLFSVQQFHITVFLFDPCPYRVDHFVHKSDRGTILNFLFYH